MKTENKKILVVDDDFSNFYLIKELLSNYEITVLYASCGIEAIKQCIEDKNISLIFMDIKMKGLNGFETALHIKEIRKEIPIIFETAYAKDFSKDELMKSIGNGFLEKPIKRETLLNEVKKHINIHNNNVPINTKSSSSIRKIFSFMFY